MTNSQPTISHASGLRQPDGMRALVQPEYAVHRPDLGGLDQARMRDRHRMQRPFELLQPEGEEAVEDRELGAQIVVLPDVGLQQRRIIGHPVENMSRGEPVALELPSKVICRHAGPPDESRITSLREFVSSLQVKKMKYVFNIKALAAC